jgi:hypothetical protein
MGFFEMPRKTDHRKAREELAKLPPDTLQAVTVRLPAGLLIDVHQWAEEKGLDLASALRDLTALGRETATRPGGQDSPAVRKAAKKWRRPVERALRNGQSPIQPLMGQEVSETDWDALRFILAGLDYRELFARHKETLKDDTPVERAWKQIQEEAAAHLQPLMEALDQLDKRFLARKKLYYKPGPDGDVPIIHWLLSENVMKQLEAESSDDAEVEAVRQLIAARYLVADRPDRPWEFMWDD